MKRLPFVFAALACRKDFPDIGKLEKLLQASLEKEFQSLGKIAARYVE